MDFWEILGISPTNDVPAVKKAYAKKLKIFHPEDDPEGFQKLREAYDSALKYSKNNNKKPAPPRENIKKDIFSEDTDTVHIPSTVNILDESDYNTDNFEDSVEEFIHKAESLYDNFFSRINIENWKELLNSQVMWYIGNREFVSDKMIEFLMENYYLPKDIWDLFESNFNWSGRKDYLYKKYPKEFIDYLFKQINSTSELRYCYFKEVKGVDYEGFLKYREEAFNALLNNDLEYAQECINNADDIYPDDPDVLIMKGRHHLHMQDIDKALDIFKNLIQKDNEDIYARYYRAKVLYDKGQIQSAFDDCKYVQQHMLDNLGFLLLFAKCYFEFGEFDKAKQLILKLLEINPDDNDAKASLEQINVQLVHKTKEKLKKSRDKKKIKLEVNKLYEELGKLKNKQIIRKLLWIMVKSVVICYIIFIIQSTIVRASIKNFGFSDIISANNVLKFITSNTKVHQIKNPEDINKLTSGINVVEGKLTNALFIQLIRISTKDKNGKDTILYLTTEEAKKKNVFDDLDAYVCIGDIGDKKVIMLVDYDQAMKIYKTESLNFKGVIHYKPSQNLMNRVKNGYLTDKFEAIFITDKVINTNTVLLKDRKIVICILSVILLIQILVVIQGLKSGYKIIKVNRRF